MARRKGRDIHGILLLDKPGGVTSNAALQKVRGMFDARRAGHSGTLDPFATGLLPVCFGEATKFSAQLLEADKSYIATARFGAATTTGDPDGEVCERAPVPDIGPEEIAGAAAGFIGETDQTPPMYSALKHEGRRLHELAREGRSVARSPRRISIRTFRLEEARLPDCSFRITCSKGTYVRTLIEDLARSLGTVAHTVALRRTAVGSLDGSDMIALEQLATLDREQQDRLLLPVDAALAEVPVERLAPEELGGLKFGNPVSLQREPSSPPGMIRIYLADRFLGIGVLGPDGLIRPRRLVRAPEDN